jgi:hypothetical protein
MDKGLGAWNALFTPGTGIVPVKTAATHPHICPKELDFGEYVRISKVQGKQGHQIHQLNVDRHSPHGRLSCEAWHALNLTCCWRARHPSLGP